MAVVAVKLQEAICVSVSPELISSAAAAANYLIELDGPRDRFQPFFPRFHRPYLGHCLRASKCHTINVYLAECAPPSEAEAATHFIPSFVRSLRRRLQ